MYQGNIVFVHDTSGKGKLSTRWLCEWPIAALQDGGYFVESVGFQDALEPTPKQARVIDQADIVVYERHVDDPWLPFLEWCAKEKRLIFLMDDAYWLAPEGTSTHKFWSKNDRIKKLDHVASLAEKVVAPNKKLCERYPNGHFKPNRPNFKDPAWSVSPLFSDNVIVWGGTQGHITGIEGHPFLEAANKLCEGGLAFLIAISGSPQIEAAISRAVPSAQIIDFMTYPDWLRTMSSAVVNACPIGPGYDEYRSWIKVLESAATGTAWVASDSPVYDGVEGGVKAGDDVDAWYEALSHLLLNPGERQALVEHGIRWAWEQGVSDHLDEWEEIFDA